MRCWHQDLIPKLCRQHLLAMWAECNGMYSIIVNNKKGYRNHPAVKEFEHSIWYLWIRLDKVRNEMLKRGYRPKDLPNGLYYEIIYSNQKPKEWQSLDEQIAILRAKGCDCKV